MKYCIAIGKTTSDTTPLPLAGEFAGTMAKARKMGYDAVEIHTPDVGSLDIGSINDACKELGMSVATLGTGQLYGKYGLHLMDPNPAKQVQIVEAVKRYIDVAKELGSKVTIGSIKGNAPKGEKKEPYLAIMGKCLMDISNHAVNQEVFVLLEATNRYENNVLNTGAEVVSIIEEYGLRNVQVLMDSFHVNMEEAELAGCLAGVKDYLGHIHFGDNTRWYPGAGSFNYGVFCQSIKDIGYDGVLSVECYPLPDGDTAALKSMEFFRRYFG